MWKFTKLLYVAKRRMDAIADAFPMHTLHEFHEFQQREIE